MLLSIFGISSMWIMSGTTVSTMWVMSAKNVSTNWIMSVKNVSTVWTVPATTTELPRHKECTCETCTTEDEQWFSQHFQKTFNPFLTGSCNLSQETFNWWKIIQCEECHLSTYKEIIKKIFEIIPEPLPVVEARPHRCRTCAVVGNSGNLKKSHYGKLINQHDNIFRINFGRTQGFEEDVGNRTTHRAMYPESATNLDNNTNLVFFNFKLKDLYWLLRAVRTSSNAQIKHKPITNKNRVMVVNPTFIQYVHESWLLKTGEYPSTGFMTVILALHLCDKVSVFGFGADRDGNWSHYFEVLHDKGLRTGPHPGSAEPFLTREYELPQSAFNWWKKIQSEKRDFNSFNKTKEKVFKTIPAEPPVVEASPHRCRTCAVVGNSANLRRSHYGKLIHQHDSVFRINFGQTEGFEEDVGNRTTHRVIYPETASNLDNNTNLVLFPFMIKDLEWVVQTFGPDASSKDSPIANKDRVMVVNPAFMQHIHELWLQKKGQYPSTGFMTVILALYLCDEVSVFGFGADSDGNWSHYWEELKNKKLKTGNHPGSVEYDMILKLARQGKIVFYRGF
ncbi:hypothetical protein WMY93_019644 [Mugilogobius chulae]|uniref:Uncharacterized protein n=1 Tax=Mugilogobius chulae TaxID=88201 RepID=A0AAW0NLQ0_9GOBI